MQPQDDMSAVIDRKRYSVKTATKLAGDDYWDGHNYERRGTNTFLYRTRKGSYFAVHLTQWQGQRDTIEPLALEEAISLWERLPMHYVEFEEAFPAVTVEEA